MKPLRQAGVATLGALLICASGTARADIEDVRAEVQKAEAVVAELETRYLKPALLERDHRITARISNGQVFYLTGDYERASMVLLDVAERAGARSHPGYREALFYLADSLFKLRNFNAATRWFEEVAQRGTAEQKERAIGRLLEIAVAVRDEAAAARYLAQAENALQGDADPALLYAVGKFHYRRAQHDKAVALFRRIPESHADWYRARYYAGVTLVHAGRLDDAKAEFEILITRGESSEGLNDVQVAAMDQARLALGRIHYEKDAFGDAISAYAAVPRDSKVFDRALYESVWISIKQSEYEHALRKLEIQLISQPDVLRGPDARLLQGKLLLMLARFDAATKAFQEVLFEFEPMQAEMRRIMRRNQGNLVAYFNRLIGRNIANFDLSSFLPGRAAEFAGADVEADRALLLVSDLAAQRRDVDGMHRTIRRLETALAADSRIQIFPKLSEGWIKAAETRARLVVAQGELVDELSSKVERKPKAYRRLREARKALGKRYRETPRSAVALRARGARMTDQIRRIDQDLFKLDLAIRGLEAQLAAITRFIEDRSRIAGPSEKDRRTLANVDIELGRARQLRSELETLSDTIEAERIEVGVGDYASERDEYDRRKYMAALETELEWLRARGVSTASDLLSKIRDIDLRASRYQRMAGNLVDERVAELRAIIEREKRNIGMYDADLHTYQTETETLGGAIAARNFRGVLERVDALVLEADIGLVDVAWKQKSDKSAQITRLLERQTADLEALEASYRELTRE